MKCPLPKGMLLDMDDTILAFEQVADASWVLALEKYADDMLSATNEELLTAIKAKARAFWSNPHRSPTAHLHLDQVRAEIVGNALDALGIYNPELACSIAATYGEERERAIEPFPRAIDTVRQLRTMGVKLALVTNGDAAMQRRKIERFRLEPLFDCLLIEGECVYGKPDERIYLRALTELGLSAEDVWMIGDNLEWEVAAPQRLGIKSLWIDHRGMGLPDTCSDRPFRVIRTLSDVLDFIDVV